MSILFIGAHPDDIELGCAGTICYFLEKKHNVYCYHLTNGEYSDVNGKQVRSFEEITETTKKSLGVLGVKEDHIYYTNIPATQLVVNKKTISGLQKFLIDHNIKTIFTHPNPDTYHQDHRAAHNISMASARRFVKNIFLFEIMFNYASGLMIPNYYIDISNFIEKKKEALRVHQTEYIKYGKEKWIEANVSLAKFRGMQVETEFAEAFYVMKYVLE